MKLSDLMQFQKDLRAMDVRPSADHAYNDLKKIVKVVQDSVLQFGSCQSDLSDSFDQVNRSFTEFRGVLEDLNRRIEATADTMRPTYFQESYRLYDKEMVNETTEYILDRKLVDVTPHIYDFMLTRSSLYSDWRFPGMIIRPGREYFVDRMVGCDPLYLVDQNHDLLRPSIEKFNEQYQQRLRPYVFYERDDGPILRGLPDNQFGCVIAYNFFNFRPFETIERWLREIFDKLRPGGTLAMTFNNCDLPKGVMLAECHFMCYTPGRMVEKLAESIGFDIFFRYDTHDPNTWLELRKPGNLQSLRGSQTLAIIESRKYPPEVRTRIIQRARELHMPVDENIETDEQFQEVEARIQNHLIKIEKDQREARERAEQERKQREREENERIEQEEQQKRLIEKRQIEMLRQQDEERRRLDSEIRAEARGLNIPDWDSQPLKDLAGEIRRIKDMRELDQLRKQCVRLRLDSTDRIMRHHSLQDLRNLIEKWRKDNERSST